jgi:hypothetical protein
VRRCLLVSDADKVEDTEEGWELAEGRCRPLLPCRDSKFDFDCNEQRMLMTFTAYINSIYKQNTMDGNEVMVV